MKQQINLYSATLLPVKPRLTLMRLCLSMLLLLVVGASMFFLLQFQDEKLATRILASQQQEQRLSNELAETAAAINASQPSPEFVSQKRELELTLESFDMLSEALSQDKTLIQPGFSNLMRDLSAIADNRVWLQSFKLAQNQLELSGQAHRAEAIPTWLDELGRQPSLQGRVLSKMDLLGEAGKPVTFTVGHWLEQAETESVSSQQEAP